MIILKDTFNNCTISHHRTVLAAEKARRKHLCAVRRNNGASSYLTYSITSTSGEDISDEIYAAREALDCR